MEVETVKMVVVGAHKMAVNGEDTRMDNTEEDVGMVDLEKKS